MVWDKVCRICSCSGDYQIFAKIPTYLHANYNDILIWQKPINKLIEETTGLKISQDDEYPKHICAVCISYLKHAVAFREQYMKNILILKSVLKSQRGNVSDTEEHYNYKENQIPIVEEDLDYSAQREAEAVNLLANISLGHHNKVNKQLLDVRSPFDLQNLNDVCNSGNALALNNTRFKYENKREVTSFPEINSPSPSERKCQACCRRYMIKESYLEHKNYCLQSKFLSFIKQLKDVRDNKSNMPSHEFVRNIVIHLCNIINWLNINYNDILPPELLTNNTKVNNNSVIRENECSPVYLNSRKQAMHRTSTPNNILEEEEMHRRKAEQCLDFTTDKLADLTFELSSPSDTSITNTQTESSKRKYSKKAIKYIENFDQITEAIEIKSSRKAHDQSIPKLNSCLVANVEKVYSPNVLLDLETEIASSPTRNNHTTYLNLNYAARCDYCDLLFKTLRSFEEHNGIHHNNYKNNPK